MLTHQNPHVLGDKARLILGYESRSWRTIGDTLQWWKEGR